MKRKKRNRLRVGLVMSFLIFWTSGSAQFVINGSAADLGGGEYLLTPDLGNQVGSLWYGTRVSLYNSFEVNCEMYFGVKDSRAGDGIAFSLQQQSTSVGVVGNGMGIGGISPSLFAEFDTHKNGEDPIADDHVAIQQNGDNDHAGVNNLDGPVPIVPGPNPFFPGNVETGQWYEVQIIWDAPTETFSIYVDCDLKVSHSGDVIDGIFGGDDLVYWGFSAGTGGFSNEQKVRNIRSNLLIIEDQFICGGSTSVPISVPPTASNFSWNTTVGIDDPVSLTPTFSPLTTTEYIISYDGFCGSTIADTFTVFVGGGSSVDLGEDTAVCGVVNITLDAQNAGSDYLWDNGAITQTRDVITGGTYWVEVTNTGGCTETDTIIISSASDLLVNLGEDTVLCPGETLTLDAGHNGAAYSWNVGGVGQTLPVTAAGQFIVDVNSGGCSGSDTIDVTLGTAVSIDLGSDTSLCAGETMVLDASNVGLSHLWSTTEITDQITINSTGTYHVRVSNSDGCFDQDTLVVSSAMAISVDLGVDTTLCAGQSLALDAGNVGSSYEWNDASIGQTLIANPGNSYWVEVTSSEGCMDQDTILVSTSTSLAVNLGNDTSFCEGQSLLLDAGFSGSIFVWNTGAAIQTVLADTSGTYIVEVNDNGCTGSDTIQITVDPTFTINLGNDTTVCGTPNLTLDAGIGGASYAWSNATNAQTIAVTSDGTYSVIVTQGTCSDEDSIVISSSSTVQVNLGSDTTICEGQTVMLDAGVSGDWNTGETGQTISVDSSGEYIVEVGSAGCTITDTIQVTIDPSFTINLGNDTTVCGTPNLTLDAGIGGASYAWSNATNAQTIAVTSDGTYSVIVTQGTCSDEDSIVISSSSTVQLDLGSDTTICEGQTVMLDAGVLGDWNTGETGQMISVDSSGQYIVEVGSAGCTITDTIQVTIEPSFAINLGNDTTVCGTPNLTLDAGIGGASYAWSNATNAQTIAVASDGTYSVIVSQGACSDEDSIVISSLAAVQANLGRDTSACIGQTIVLDAGVSGNWNTGDVGPSISTDTSGIFIVSVGSGICADADTIQVIIASSLAVSLGSVSAICSGDSILLDAGFAGQTHVWESGELTQTIWATSAGQYKVTVTDAQGCSGSDSVQLTVESLPTVSLGNDISICEGDSTLLGTGLPSGTYSWSTGASDPTIFVKSAGDYIVQVTDVNNCSNSDTLQLSLNPLPMTSITMQPTACVTDSVLTGTFSPLGGVLSGVGVISGIFDYTSDSIIKGQPTWLYYTYTDLNYCVGKDSTSMIIYSSPSATVTTLNSSLCAGGSATLEVSGTGIVSYDWYQVGSTVSLGSTDLVVTGDGDYYAAISDVNCSAYSDTMNVSLSSPSVTIVATPNTTITEGESVTLAVDNPNGSFSYDWVNQTTGESGVGDSWLTSPAETSDIMLTASFDTCSLDELVTITVLPLPAVDDVRLPDAFTPNGDGVNDQFTILNIEDYPNAEIVIFNRWELLLYMAEGGVSYQSAPWDGTYMGESVPAGVYYYSIYLKDDENRVLTGSVNVMY